MNLSERDRKIALAIVPILLLVVYWFLLLAPKRDEAKQASADAAAQSQRLDQARTAAQAAQGAKTDFAADYAEIVRLGKAIPASVDMPSLVVQLDRAAAGTGIRFTRIAQGQRETTAAAPAPATPPATGQGDTSNGSTPVQAGGATAQSGPGSAVETANNSAAQQSQAAQAAEQSGVASSDTQTSTSSGSGLPIGGGAATGGATTAASTAGALDTVPLELEFVGNFFSLSDFFHSIKRFVHMTNSNVVVGGRLITIEGVKFESDPDLFPKIKAELEATVYLSPKVEGATAGATPQGPTTTPASTTTTPSSTPSPAPTATVTP